VNRVAIGVGLIASLLAAADPVRAGVGDVYIPNAIDDPALHSVAVNRLDGSGFLRGDYADVDNSLTTRAFSASADFTFDPTVAGDPRLHFAETMAYYHITDFNEYVSTLGYAAAQFSIPVTVFAAMPQGPLMFPVPTEYDTTAKALYFAATIDLQYTEALDADVIIHEYVHAVQHDLLGGAPGPFVSSDVNSSGHAFSIIEAIADYFAASRFDDAELGEVAASLIGQGVYVRSVENFRVWPDDFVEGAPYRSSMICSGALWDLRSSLSAAVVDALVLEMIPLIVDANGGTPQLDATIEDALTALLQADTNLHGGAFASDIGQAFAVRGIGSFDLTTGLATQLHPGNNFDATQIEQVPAAQRVVVKFDRYATKLDDLPFDTTMAPQSGVNDKTTRDELEILDASDNVVGVYSARQLQGQTLVVLGDTVKFHLTTDASIPPFGYRVLDVAAGIFGDHDGDGDVDLNDYAVMADCMFGPDITPAPNPPTTAAQCLAVFDADFDQDVDLADIAALQTDFGP